MTEQKEGGLLAKFASPIIVLAKLFSNLLITI